MKGTITKAKVLQYLRKTKTIDSDIANVLLSIVDGISADDFSVITEMAEAGQDISLFLDIDEYEIYCIGKKELTSLVDTLRKSIKDEAADRAIRDMAALFTLDDEMDELACYADVYDEYFERVRKEFKSKEAQRVLKAFDEAIKAANEFDEDDTETAEDEEDLPF